MNKKDKILELEAKIESIWEFLIDTDQAQLDLEEAQQEYKKLTGKEYE